MSSGWSDGRRGNGSTGLGMCCGTPGSSFWFGDQLRGVTLCCREDGNSCGVSHPDNYLFDLGRLRSGRNGSAHAGAVGALW